MNIVFKLRTYILLIIFIGLILYSKGLINGFVGDDDLQILRNTKVHSITNLPSFFFGSTYENAGSDAIAGIFYRPIMMTVFSLAYSLVGPNPVFFHLIQLLFHIVNAILIFLFFRYFFRDKSSFILSIIFLIHPVNSEAVLYSANLQEVLFFFFGMLGLLILQQKEFKRKQMFFIPFLVLLSLFSKESGVLFTVMVLLYSLLFDKKKSRLKSLLISLPITFAIYLFFRYVVAHMQAANTSLAPISNATLSERIINISSLVFYYLRMFFYPKTMGVDQFWFVKSINLWNFWMPLLADLFFMGLIFLGYIWTIRKHKANKNLYLFFMLWFFVGLLLHIQILPLDATVADRWFYFPSIGLLGLIGIVFKQINLIRTKRAQIIVGSIIFGLLLILSARTFIRISDWRTNLTLYEHDIRSQNNFILENAYGTALIQDEQFEKAKPEIEKSIKEYPYSANLNNLAIIYAAQGNKLMARKSFEDATKKGQNFSVYENYANFLLYYDKSIDALNFSEKAVKLFPDSPKLWLVLAQSAYLNGKRDQALKAATKSYQLQPNDAALNIFIKIRDNKPLRLKHY